ncbi:MAG TPA: universal stress protein [Acidimicrobiales bacterium]|jgi:nucleotide-binding universal stress UspA family protein|nr:universal stress protein [Acidimicrobiales bacterium]
MFSTIVVGTDGSQTAKRAVHVAANLARQLDGRLHVVNGYRDPADPGGTGMPVAGPYRTTSSRWREASEGVLAEALTDPALDGVAVEPHSVVGGPSDALVAVAEAVGADLIVVGNRGLQGARRLPDSIPETVAHRAPCHVLIVKTT